MLSISVKKDQLSSIGLPVGVGLKLNGAPIRMADEQLAAFKSICDSPTVADAFVSLDSVYRFHGQSPRFSLVFKMHYLNLIVDESSGGAAEESIGEVASSDEPIMSDGL